MHQPHAHYHASIRTALQALANLPNGSRVKVIRGTMIAFDLQGRILQSKSACRFVPVPRLY